MDKDIVFINCDIERTQERIQQLVIRTLTPLESVIDMIAVKVGHDKTLPSATFDFNCTILLKFEGDTTIRTKASDCDGILAVNRALTQIIDQIPQKDVNASNNKLSSHP